MGFKWENEDEEEENEFVMDDVEYTDEDRIAVYLSEFNIYNEIEGLDVLKSYEKVGKQVLTKDNKPTLKFFKWYLEQCGIEQVEIIKIGELTDSHKEAHQERLNELMDLKTLMDKDVQKSSKDKEELNAYIEKNRELIKEVHDLQEDIKKHHLNYEATITLLSVLYAIMTDKMDVKKGAKFTPKEVKLIGEIEEVLEIE